jgi:hypothetical protein
MNRTRAALRRIGALGAALAAAGAAWGDELVLPCHGPDGNPVANTVTLAILENNGGELLRGTGQDGRCRIALPAGAYWVKAEAPGMRSVAIRVVDAAASGRELRMHPLSGIDTDGQQRLQQMVERDQAVRKSLAETQQLGNADLIGRAEREMEQVDSVHRAEIGLWLQERGFPHAAEVGYAGVGAFWLLLQHAPELLAPQLPAMRAAVAAGELSRSSLALSEDRVDLIQGRPQRYGSQLQSGADGKLGLYRLALPESVDARRAEMDLEPLAAYLERFGLRVDDSSVPEMAASSPSQPASTRSSTRSKSSAPP